MSVSYTIDRLSTDFRSKPIKVHFTNSIYLHSGGEQKNVIDIDDEDYKIEDIKKMLAEFHTMKYKIDQLEENLKQLNKVVEELVYAPGGPAFQEAKDHWESAYTYKS